MKKLREFKIDSIWIFLICFLYLELIFKIVTKSSIFNINLIYILLFTIFYILVCKLISSLFPDKYNKIITYIIIFFTSFYYAVQVVVYKIFGFFFELALLGTTDQVMDFAGDAFKLIGQNILYIILLFIPFIVSLIFNKNIKTPKINKKSIIIYIISIILSYGIFFGSLFIKKNGELSAYKLYFENHNIELSLKDLGVVNTFFIDLERTLFGFEEKIVLVDPGKIVNPNEIVNGEYGYNNLDINFDNLIENSSGTINTMHQYFKNEEGTLKNKYTNYFDGKNLILFMAESFNEIAVSEELTPTLYKLVNSGFVFDNFYSPTISSTIGGEFQEITGLVATKHVATTWKRGTNTFPYGIGTKFQEKDYETFAYHNHNYYFQNRYKYLAAMGFDNFMACNKGLEKKINCKLWPESDVEMIDATFDDYINSEKPFFTYYVTVSGHGGYSWGGNNMSKKHKAEVQDLPYSEPVKAYLAAQIELDKALELLIQKLEDSGKLDDTVIALVGDHHPYMLTIDEINEVASYKKDDRVEVSHSNFILWNNKMETTHVEKVGSQIDVLPTLYNLFGINYDSRLIIGKDILSTHPGLAIFYDQSWVSDYGTYYAVKRKFEANEGVEIPEGYVKNMNQIVANKINMSKLILEQDYYKYIK